MSTCSRTIEKGQLNHETGVVAAFKPDRDAYPFDRRKNSTGTTSSTVAPTTSSGGFGKG